MLIPGFLATDRTTMDLRRALARVLGWLPIESQL
mgnify:CR=1 FL=1